jgi:hypothetical protein
MLEIRIEATQLCATLALVATEQTRRRNNMSVNFSKHTRSEKMGGAQEGSSTG